MRRILQTRCFSRLSVDTINGNVLKAQYAVRGPVAVRAEQLASLSPSERPFDSIIRCNIGNPQALKQKPLSFVRDVLSIMVNPSLIDRCDFAPDVVARANVYLDDIKSVGAYSTSAGSSVVRSEVAEFLEARDGYPADSNNIYLSNGASDAVKMILQLLIRENELGHNDGILCPVPQYPLYSGAVALNNGHLLPYYLEEENDWGMSIEALDEALAQAQREGKTARALVVINPGNPTGSVLSEQQLRDVCRWCRDKQVLLMADEVYQENIWKKDAEFVSCRKVAYDLDLFTGPDPLQLVSFHSISKGFLGECGMRGGYVECLGLPDDVTAQIYKLASMALCSNVVGQLAVGLMTCPPKPGDGSFDTYEQERDGILAGMQHRALMLREGLNKLEGVSCADIQGAMYAFPTITLPANAVAAAAQRGIEADDLYCRELLEATGIVVVPGSGFWQMEGTFHFRTTILPPTDEMSKVVENLGAFHNGFLERYK